MPVPTATGAAGKNCAHMHTCTHAPTCTCFVHAYRTYAHVSQASAFSRVTNWSYCAFSLSLPLRRSCSVALAAAYPCSCSVLHPATDAGESDCGRVTAQCMCGMWGGTSDDESESDESRCLFFFFDFSFFSFLSFCRGRARPARSVGCPQPS